MSHAFAKEPVRFRFAVPGSGTSVTVATEERAASVREAVLIVHRALQARAETGSAYEVLLGSRFLPRVAGNAIEPSLLAAWGMVSIRLTGRLLGVLDCNANFEDSESWFCGHIELPQSLARLIGDIPTRRAVAKLETIAHDEHLWDLLPYVLDGHGPGSRASVLRDPKTITARQAKRAGGVFYTPADVAEYIAKQVIALRDEDARSIRFLDPACGSGVFLRAVLEVSSTRDSNFDRFQFAQRSLFGVDIDPLAVNAACFVLLYDCLRTKPATSTPWSMWHCLRSNIVVADALTLRCDSDKTVVASDREALREALGDHFVPPAPLATQGSSHVFGESRALGDVLPELSAGADVILGNPPYASAGRREDAPSLELRFASFAANKSGDGVDLFPLFIEMMWRLARPGRSAAGMVVPLSLAYQRGKQMTACRRALASSGGRWKFAFFDREPHALFGEDVKTRNAIVFRCERASEPARGEESVLETGPLRKWTSRSRAQLFDDIGFTPLGGQRIDAGIPKLESPVHYQVFRALRHNGAAFSSFWTSSYACRPAETALDAGMPRVFVASTAYNFLNVFRAHSHVPASRVPWSENGVHALEFATEDRAAQALAILSSRLTYWLWQVLEDGFHVRRGFLEDLPLGDTSFNKKQATKLTMLGTHLWRALQTHQVVSVNGGRQTVAYRPHACEDLRDHIDLTLLEALGIEYSFIEELRRFVRGVVTVDENDHRRRRFSEQFTGSESKL